MKNLIAASSELQNLKSFFVMCGYKTETNLHMFLVKNLDNSYTFVYPTLNMKLSKDTSTKLAYFEVSEKTLQNIVKLLEADKKPETYIVSSKSVLLFNMKNMKKYGFDVYITIHRNNNIRIHFNNNQSDSNCNDIFISKAEILSMIKSVL